MSTHLVVRAGDLGAAAVLAVSRGGSLQLDDAALVPVRDGHERLRHVLEAGLPVYGTTTGAGAQSGVALGDDARAAQSASILLARQVGGPPWLTTPEVRAVLAVRLRTLLSGDSGAGPDLCRWIVSLLDAGVVPAVPRTAAGSAGEIVPLAHLFGHLAEDASPLRQAGLEPHLLGPKEGIALLAGVPVSTALAILRADDARLLLARSQVVAAAQVAVVGASRDPFEPWTGRGDDVLTGLLEELSRLSGPEPSPRHLQAPVSFRVVGPVLAQVSRDVARLDAAVERALSGVTDSPALRPGDDRGVVGTAGFHGLDLAASADAVTASVVHAASAGAARLHRMLDPRVTGLPAQLSADPGPQAGLVAVHKRAAGVVRGCQPVVSTAALAADTSLGQEDVQSAAVDATEATRRALEAWRDVLACELLGVHQATRLDPSRLESLTAPVRALLADVDAVLPAGTADRPWGRDVEALVGLLAEREEPGRT
ncbi:MAG: aromatic amino acid lyase [Nocardioidaceae bacterium]|nr:aromatic amino acid lyase [Nocardioidaceae bacterium]